MPRRGDWSGQHLCCFLTLTLSTLFSVLLTPAVRAQKADPLFSTVPFGQWVAQGHHADIPWKVKIRPTELGNDQRLVVAIDITVDGYNLAHRPPGGELVTLIQIEDSQGRIYQDHGVISLKHLNRDVRRADIVFMHRAMVMPGDYHLTLALLHAASGDHDLMRETIHVEPLKKDPLPSSWEGLPPVEIFGREDGMEMWFHPEMTGRLRIPVENHLPVRIELMVNLPPWSGYLYSVCMRTLIPQLKALSEMGLRNGVINITLLDVPHRQAIPITRQGQPLDWRALKTGLDKANPNMVDVRALGQQVPAADFLSEEIRQRIAEQAAGAAGAEEKSRLILIVVGVSEQYGIAPSWKPAVLNNVAVEEAYLIRDFPPFNELQSPLGPNDLANASRMQPPIDRGAGAPIRITLDSEIPVPNGAPRRLLVPRRPPWNLPERKGFISLQDVLNSVKPRVFTVKSPLQFREALSAILEDISHL